MNKKLYRSTADKKICGVCAGIAEYFDVDPTIVRVVYALLSFFTAFAGIIVYVILALIIPENPGTIETTYNDVDSSNNGNPNP